MPVFIGKSTSKFEAAMAVTEEKQLQNDMVSSTAPIRCPSQTSSLSANQDMCSSAGGCCRICHWDGEGGDSLVAPCYCSGSLRWVHQHCLQQWIKSSDIKCCELCKFQFIMNTKLKSFSQWESLQMSALEKRKLLCSVAFHCVALTCVLWSLSVLIERTAEELERGVLEWQFWTKLVVVGCGFIGGMVIIYIQCKAYFNLCRRWRSFNRVIYIQNAPEKPTKPPDPAQSPPPIDNKKPCSVDGSPTCPQVVTKDCVVTLPELTESKCHREHIDASSDEGETYALLHV